MEESRTLHQPAFWRELAQLGVMSESKLEEYRIGEKELPWKPLGAMLVRRGFLTVGQVAKLIGIQADEPLYRIGELAVQEGFCTEDDVREALRLQAAQYPSAATLMASDPEVDPRQLATALALYVRHLEARVMHAEHFAGTP